MLRSLELTWFIQMGLWTFVWKTVIMQSNSCSESLIHTSENLLTALGAEYWLSLLCFLYKVERKHSKDLLSEFKKKQNNKPTNKTPKTKKHPKPQNKMPNQGKKSKQWNLGLIISPWANINVLGWTNSMQMKFTLKNKKIFLLWILIPHRQTIKVLSIWRS